MHVHCSVSEHTVEKQVNPFVSHLQLLLYKVTHTPEHIVMLMQQTDRALKI